MAKYTDNPQSLARVASLGFEKMEKFRKARMKMLGQYVGRFYGHPSIDRPTVYPLNLIYQAVTSMVPNLAYNNPEADVATEFMAYRPYAQMSELALTHLIREINMRDSTRKIITDALFLAGFAKCGLGVSSQTLDIDGYLADIGQPYWDRVDPDDMLLDPIARVWEEQDFMGNRYRLTVDEALEAGLGSRNDLGGVSSRYDGVGGMYQEASTLSMRSWTGNEADILAEYKEFVDIYIVDEHRIVTMPWKAPGIVDPVILREVDYEGPEEGPYQMLGFAFVPDNIFPVAPAMIWYDLHIMANKIARKLADKAERGKSILAYTPASWEDAQEIVDAADGEAIKVENIDEIREITFGGATPEQYEFMAWVKEQFSEMAMNIDLLSGTRSDEPTATQAEMVQANTSIRLADMQDMVYNFVGEGMRRLFFYLHTDPLIELPLVKRVAGRDQQVVYTPEMREGDWLDYYIKVKPFSMARQDPNVKVRRLLEFSGNVIPALAQAQQMLGPAFKLENAVNIVGREMGLDELDEIIDSQVIHDQMEKMKQLIDQAIPLSPKVIQYLMNPASSEMAGVQPGNPNPDSQMASGITPQVETNRRRQETAGELQAAFG